MYSAELDLILITPHGRSGSLFLQSLLDGHPNIVSIPGIGLKYNIDLNFSTKLNLVNNFISNHLDIFDLNLGYLGQVGTNVTEKLNADGDKNLNLSQDVFQTLLLEYLDYGSEPALVNISRKDFWIAVHKSYAKLLGNDPEELKYIVFHEHNYSGGHELAFADFPSMHYFATIRDPREDWLSWKKVQRIRFGTLFYSLNRFLRYQNLMSYSDYALNLIKIIDYMPREKILIIDLNRLHSLNEDAMKFICQMIDIDYRKSMIESTFNGLTWNGNAADRTASSGFDVAKKNLNWPFKLRKKEISYIESFLAFELRAFRYPISQKSNIRKIRFPYISAFMYLALIKNRIHKPLEKIETVYPKYSIFAVKTYRLMRDYALLIALSRSSRDQARYLSDRRLMIELNSMNFL